jgi:hypothetical protein
MVIRIDTVSLLARGFADNSRLLKSIDRFDGRWLANAQEFDGCWQGYHGMRRKKFKEPQCRDCRPWRFGEAVAVRANQPEQALGGIDPVVSRFSHTLQKEFCPAFPVSVGTHGGQPLVILLAVTFERYA